MLQDVSEPPASLLSLLGLAWGGGFSASGVAEGTSGLWELSYHVGLGAGLRMKILGARWSGGVCESRCIHCSHPPGISQVYPCAQGQPAGGAPVPFLARVPHLHSFGPTVVSAALPDPSVPCRPQELGVGEAALGQQGPACREELQLGLLAAAF